MTRQDLPALYLQAGFHVVDIPIPGGGVPVEGHPEQTVTTVIQHAQAGQHMALHRNAGIGWTGMVAAAMAQCLLGVLGGVFYYLALPLYPTSC